MRFFYLLTTLLLLISGCTSLNKNSISINSKVVTLPTIIEEEKVISENSELKKVMREFDYILFSKLNSEVEEGEENMFFGKNTQSLLKEFIADSKKIESLYPDADNNYFILSQALTKDITKLYKIVKVKKMEWVKPQIENIINICNRCHDLYGV